MDAQTSLPVEKVIRQRRPSKYEKFWWGKAAAMMIRNGLSLMTAAKEMGVELTRGDVLDIERQKSFERVLWTERYNYWKEIATDPERSKNSSIGQLQLLAQKLMEDGSWSMAADTIFKIAKLENWVGGDTQVNVLGGLSEREFKDLERKLKQRSAGTSSADTAIQ